MVKIKKHDFIEIEYTGTVKDGNIIFDTTYEDVAKKNDIFNSEFNYGPVKIMVGNSQILPGLEKFVEDKEPGAYKVSLNPEQGFGKKNSKLLKLIPTNIFLKQQINPVPGLPINMDGLNGIIKTVSGGRCIVDFNHPLAGKELEYDLKINNILTDEKDKVSAIVEMQIKKNDFELSLENGKGVITLKKDLKKPIKDLIADMIKKFTGTKEVEFKENISEKKTKKNS
jgi:FKBP-type peptidyl-prolyl cis-trans isomerase SlyD